jgi:anti-anti-sigma factor
MPTLHLEHHPYHGYSVVTLRGDLVRSTAQEYKDALTNHAHPAIIELTALTFVDSVGLGALVVCYKRIRARELAMAHVCDRAENLRLYKLLDKCDLIKCLNVYQALIDARSSLEPAYRSAS